MTFPENAYRIDERIAYELRALYRKFGYSRYRMSKFEEYDLYVRNKDFLVSDGVITFTDTNGRLMALKPDVTLSIIRNTQDGGAGVQKMYYNENVYRVSPGTHAYKEIPQAGLELIGALSLYDMCEVIALAARSLSLIGPRPALALSHMGYVSALMDEVDAPEDVRSALVRAISRKSAHEIREICLANGVGAGTMRALAALTTAYESVPDALKALNDAARGPKMAAAVRELELICEAMRDSGFESMLSIDLSIANDMNYYSGVVFKGYVEGVPTGVLSGGRYDKLMRRMGRDSGAIGFAVYLDLLELLDKRRRACDADVLLIYPEDAPAAQVFKRAQALTEAGETVFAATATPEGMRFKRSETLQINEDAGREDAGNA